MPGSGTSVYTGTVKFHVGCLGDTTVIGTHWRSAGQIGGARAANDMCVYTRSRPSMEGTLTIAVVTLRMPHFSFAGESI